MGTVPRTRQTGGMRVVAGSARGRRILVPDGDGTRPTADRVREAMFNSLYSLGVLDDVRVIDVFAGSGALGLEALSRGAAHCTFVENDRRALDALRTNLDTLGFLDAATVVAGDGPSVLRQQGDIDLVLLDPPYAFDAWDELLATVAERLPEAMVVIESDREIDLPTGWETHRARRYGSTVVTLASAGSP
ncbi:MAG: 16S rRNA (guanine(966)-N(2))-methyltransferase RsmD [Acidimicrobiales bacterium]